MRIKKPVTIDEIRTHAKKHIDAKDATTSKKAIDTKDDSDNRKKGECGDPRSSNPPGGQGPPSRHPSTTLHPLNILPLRIYDEVK